MKKLMILSAAFLFAIQFANAQTEKGDQTLGVNLGYSYLKYNDLNIDPDGSSVSNVSGRNGSFNIGPAYSYFIANKLDIGTSLDYATTLSTNAPDVYNDMIKQFGRTYGGQLYLRKYFMLANKIGFRAGPYMGYYRQTEQSYYPAANAAYNSNSKSNSYDAGINLELVYYPAKHMGVSASMANLSYSHIKTNNGSQGNSSDDDVNLDFINDGLSFSIFYVFGGK